MSRQPPPPLDEFVATEIHARAKALTRAWLQQLEERLRIRPSRLLPTRALMDHIPQVLEGVGDFVLFPGEAVKSRVAKHLRMLAQLRREQGYDISELLVEFEGMGRIVSDAFVQIIEAYPGPPDPVEVAHLAGRIQEGLAEITSVTVSTYRQEEQEQKRELSRTLSTFARSLAHELKTPLNAASSAMSMLDEGAFPEDPEEQHRFVEIVSRNLQRATDLLGEVHVLALNEGAQATQEWVSLGEVVNKVKEAMWGRAREKGVEIRIEGELPEIEVDAVRMEIALINLVSNAIKYSDPGKEHRWVAIRGGRIDEGHEGVWRISVEDNGLGIPEELQNHIFRRHFRGHPEVAEGTGLGLAIAENVVVQKGGELSFESVEGKGSVFRIDVPQHEPTGEHEGSNDP